MTQRSTPGRRLLLGGGLATLATGATLGTGGRASAAPPTDPWLAGGNTGVDATNFIGPRNVAPLVFKTAAVADTPLERLRITPDGRVGVGVTDPGAVLHARTTSGSALRGQAVGAGAGNTGVDGIATNGYGVVGKAIGTGTGVLGQHTTATGAAPGVLGETNSRSANAAGVVGRVNPTDPGASSGVWGVNNGTGPSGVGVWGSHAGGGYGVYATAVSGTGVVAQAPVGVRATGTGSAGIGVSADGFELGVLGKAAPSAVLGVGVHGEASPAVGQYGIGVVGEAGYIGVEGRGATPGGAGVWGHGHAGLRGSGAGEFGVGIYAQGAMYAGDFGGNVRVSGTLSKTAGSFRIDHPLDPEQQWLSHSFVESPDMMNVYNGNVTTGADGRVTVELPDYFAVLNRDFRYQLTVIGAFAQAIVEREITDRSFVIATDRPRVKVSWQVTGIRQDDYAREHPIVVEEPKSAAERGTRTFVPRGSTAKRYEPMPASTAP